MREWFSKVAAHGGLAAVAALGLAWPGWVAGCVGREPYACTSGLQCISSSDAQGVCLPSHTCAYSDATCGATGLRYGESAGDQALTCVTRSAASACITNIASGAAFNCAVKVDGTVWCWGSDDQAQLGNGDPAGSSGDHPVSVAFPSPTAAKSIGLGEGFACILADDGTVWCWGANGNHELGQGQEDTGARSTPVQVPLVGAMPPIIDIAVGGKHACVVDSAKTVWCWGENGHEQCGQKTANPCPGVTQGGGQCEDLASPAPVSIPGFSAVAVVVGDEFSCALDDLFEVRCWGDNSLGELGIVNGLLKSETGETRGDLTQTSVPQKVGVGTFLRVDLNDGEPQLALGDEHACVSSGGSVICWGSNGSGQVGTGAKGAPEFTPRSVASARSVVSGAASNHSCAIDSHSGALSCWGSNENGQVGRGSTEEILKPELIPLVSVRRVSLGDRHSCALLSEGSVYCWGANDRGQLGLPASGPMLSPKLTPLAEIICR